MQIALAAALGALFAYFFDPQNGRRRRNTTRDRLLGKARGAAQTTAQTGQAVSAQAAGLKAKATHLREQPKDLDDVTLARKVESEIFRPEDAPKGSVDVNVEDGVVYLRGEVERPDLIDELVAKARSVQGVREVESLLHLPGTPAPMKD